MDIPLAELPRHITERGNPGNREGISHVEIDVPAGLLRYGFRFIDTPGLGSSIAANTRTTRDFLKEADAFLVVTGFDAPLAAEEIAVLDDARRAGQRIFLAVNKQDLLADEDRAMVLDHIATRLDAGGLSGIDALRSALIGFMIEDKARAFLTNMVGRVGALGGSTAAPEFRVRLAAIAGQIDRVTQPVPEPETLTRNAVIRRSCPVCAAVSSAVFDTIAQLQYRLGHDATRRRAFAEHETLCPPHAWQFGRIAARLSVAGSLAEAVETMAARLDADGRDPTSRICPVCTAAKQAQAQAIATLTGQPAIAGVSICLPHLPLLMASIPSSRRSIVRDEQAAMMRRVVEDMRRFMLKREGQERHALTREEEEAANAAIRLIAGDADAFPPQPLPAALTAILADRNDGGD